MYTITFKDGMSVTIRGEEDIQVNSMSMTDITMNQLIDKMYNSETDFLRFCVAVNRRLREEVL